MNTVRQVGPTQLYSTLPVRAPALVKGEKSIMLQRIEYRFLHVLENACFQLNPSIHAVTFSCDRSSCVVKTFYELMMLE